MKVARRDTAKAVGAAIEKHGSVVKMMDHYGFQKNYMPRIYEVLRGDEISPEAEGVIRAYLDLPLIQRKEYWRPCIEQDLQAQVERVCARRGWTISQFVFNAVTANRESKDEQE